MIVAGGVYRETCARPRWRRLFGSGLRAAAAISRLSPGTRLHTYVARGWTNDVRSSAAVCGFEVVGKSTSTQIEFEYLHPLRLLRWYPPNIKSQDPLQCSGNVVLRFGFMEGDAIVHARRAIYDPQTGKAPVPFFANGSTAEELAVVLNGTEAAAATGEQDATAAAHALIRKWRADIVVIKGGTEGALVADKSGACARIPAFQTDRVFKIGSGDIFSAIFAHCWGELAMPASSAAEHASAAVSEYVQTRSLPFQTLPTTAGRIEVRPSSRTRRVYLAGPFFNLAQHWLILEAREALESFGAEVFSPLHEVGFHPDCNWVARQDLKGLEDCDVVLGIMDASDPGTIFEVGYARALQPAKPTIILGERVNPLDMTMFAGTGCTIRDDFTSAIYATIWQSI